MSGTGKHSALSLRPVLLRISLVLALCLIVTGQSTWVAAAASSTRGTPAAPAATVTMGTLATSSGPSIYDYQLRAMLDQFIPTSQAYSTLLVFTQCYGGDMMDDFAGRTGTTVLSAGSPGEVTYYGGYHDDAAKALKPGPGRTSNDVHNAGVAGKDRNEHPQQQGPVASLEPVEPELGPIQSRHVLVYAGQPAALDNKDRDTIKNNFDGKPGTIVTTVGGRGGADGYDYPATLEGLRDALQAIGSQMNENEQFILFVTDHGDIDQVDVAPACAEGTCTTDPLGFDSDTLDDLLDDPNNQPTLSLFSEGALQPTHPVDIDFPPDSFFDVSFDVPVDLDANGVIDGWIAEVDVTEENLDTPEAVTVTYDPGDTNLNLSSVSLQSGAIARKVHTHATLATSSGPSIYDYQLRAMLDQFIPTGNAHSTLLVFTQCYGGDMMDDFAGRANTTVLSAGSPGEVTYYGGYHDDAAKALRPGSGRTSNDVHNAGVAGKDKDEHPQQQGPVASLEPVDEANGPIKSRHVLVYAGQPAALDNKDRDTIKNNFDGKPGTIVTTVGGRGGADGYDYPATLEGLRQALQHIHGDMGPDEQFILFVTDHGDLDQMHESPPCENGTCVSAPLAHSPTTYGQMENDASNEPGLSLFSPGDTPPAPPVQVYIMDSFFDVTFDIPIDLDGDGALTGAGEGWLAYLPWPDYETMADPGGETITVTGGVSLTLGFISLESGEISKRYRAYLPLILRSY